MNATSDLQGVGRLLVDAVTGVTDIVEEMHRNIAGLSPIVGRAPAGRTRGITGLVYRNVRRVTGVVGSRLDMALARLAPLITGVGVSPARREAVLAALNGVLGDYLVASNNPLAIPMRLRRHGRPLTLDRDALSRDVEHPAGRLVVLVHGLCMNDLEWERDGHDHGASLERELGFSALYLHYNSGLHISTNGCEFAESMERLVQAWPVPIDELVIVGHSMGGLVARSACHHASREGHAWLRRLKTLVFLGTPHHGAPLERAGNWAHILVAISPYTAPFARLGALRSAGIRDLRHGNLVDEDWVRTPKAHRHDPRTFVPLPSGVRSFALAASRQPRPSRTGRNPVGDGLVAVNSALGVHRNATMTLPIPDARKAVCHGLHHLELLSSPEVYEQIRNWLAANQPTDAFRP